MNWKTAFVLAACAATLVAQTPPVTLLRVEVENLVAYSDDGSDPAKRATSPTVVPWPSALSRTFKANVTVGDIVAINGKPAKGTSATSHFMYMFTRSYIAGRAIADIAGGGVTHTVLAIQAPDGTPIGTIVATGVCGTAPSPGSPNDATGSDMAVTGGTGAYLGVRGQLTGNVPVANRVASMLEDPANRRTHPGAGKWVRHVQLIPQTLPDVLSLPSGPAIFHSDDSSPVTADKPARAGEGLIMSVSGLGPVKPNLEVGKPFPAWAAGKEHVVNSPVDVMVNGKAAQVISAIGWPGMNNVYRVDFRVPESTAAGTATLGLSVAWINGPEVKIPVR